MHDQYVCELQDKVTELEAEVARLREHYDEAIRANTEAVTENAQLRNTDTYQKCQSLIKERGKAWAKCHEIGVLADEAQAEVARLRDAQDNIREVMLGIESERDEREEAARWLYLKHNVPAWDDLESQKHGDQIREDAKKRWRWLEESE